MAPDAAISLDEPLKVPSLARDARSHFLVNITSNVLYTGMAAAAMTLYIPFLVGHLGVAAYGVIPLAHMAVMYMSTITEGLNITVNRYLSIDLYRRDVDAANATFSTATAISIASIGLLLPFALVGIWFFPIIFQVPAGLETQARALFTCMVATFFLSLLEANLAVSTFVYHRFDLRNLVRGVNLITRMAIPAFLFLLMPPDLWQVGIGFILGGLLGLLGFWWLWRALTPELNFSWAAVDFSRSRELVSVSGWALVNRLGMLLFLSADLVIVNWYFGADLTGQYGMLLMFPELIRQVVDALTSVLNPGIISRYAMQDFRGLAQLASRSLKFLGIGLAIPIGLLCGFSGPLLRTWIGPEFQHLDLLLAVLIGHLCINMATLPLSLVLTSYNRVRIQGLVTLALSIANILLAVALTPWGLVGVAFATAIIMTIRNVIFMASYTAYLMKVPAWTYYRPLIGGVIGTVAIGGAAYAISEALQPEGWLELGFLATLLALIYTAMAFSITLDRGDRQIALSMLPARWRRVFPRA